MGKVILSITMSTDGFVAGANDSPQLPLGEGGEQLFQWYFGGEVEIPVQDGRMTLNVSPESAKVLEEGMKSTGAMVAGRRMFDIAGARGDTSPLSGC